MGQIIATITVSEGTVVGADVLTSSELEPNINKINDHCVALLFDDLKEGKEFVDNNLQQYAMQDFDELVSNAKSEFDKFCKTRSGKKISVVIIGYANNFLERPYHELSYNGSKIFFRELPPILAFSSAGPLGKYLVQKVYSKSMPLKTATYLIAYAISQYHEVIQFSGTDFALATISRNGVQILQRDELKEMRKRTQWIDIELRKQCHDLFLNKSEVSE